MRIPLDPKTSRITEADFTNFLGIPAARNLICTRYEATGNMTE
jgi:hypothetical protein